MKSRLLPAILLLSFTVAFATQQAGGGASIEGVVVREGTQEPIVGATVTLLPPAVAPLMTLGSPLTYRLDPPAPTTTSDTQGHFVLANVAAGRYRLLASAIGYVTREFEQHARAAAGTPLEVAAGQNIKGLSVSLSSTGKVSGRITEGTTAQPLVGVHVSLVRPKYDALGNLGFDRFGFLTTNDRGEYRISEVPPGFYYVVAGGNQSSGRGSNAPPTTIPYESTYYPGETDVSKASRIEVKAGTELDRINLALRRQPFRHIRGRIVDVNTGRPPAAATIAVSAAGLIRSSSEIYNPGDGTFQFSDLEPLQYRVQVVPAVVGTASFVGGGSQSLVANVDLARSDVEDLLFQLPLEFGSLSGRAKVENLTSASWTNAAVSLQPANGDRTEILRLNADGTFAGENIKTGQYRLQLNILQPGSYIKSALLDGFNVLEEPLRVVKGLRGNLEITLSTNTAKIEGIVRDEDGRPMSGIYTALVPNQREKRIDLYKSTVTEQDGRFAFPGIAPGTYKVFAWEDAQPLMYFDPELMKLSENQGSQIGVIEKGTASIEVRISRPTR